MYKIIVIIEKEGGIFINWIRYLKFKLTKLECEKMFLGKKEVGVFRE